MRALDLDLQRDPRGDVAPAPPTKPGPGEGEASRVKRRVDRFLGDAQARGAARSGRAHPYLFDLLRAVDRNFEPDLSLIPKVKRRAPPAYFRAYKAAIKQFMKMGSALPFDPSKMGEEVTPPKLLVGQAMIAEAVMKEGGQLLTNEICVEAKPGALPVVASRRRSGVRALDRLADRAMATALRQLHDPAPADMPRARACYRYEVRFGRSLPRIGLSCSFDITLKEFGCKLPGGEFLTKKVGLARLYLGR